MRTYEWEIGDPSAELLSARVRVRAETVEEALVKLAEFCHAVQAVSLEVGDVEAHCFLNPEHFSVDDATWDDDDIEHCEKCGDELEASQIGLCQNCRSAGDVRDPAEVAEIHGFRLWDGGGGVEVLRRDFPGGYALLTAEDGEVPSRMSDVCHLSFRESTGLPWHFEMADCVVDALLAADAFIVKEAR